ncbi:jouberin isoform X1 [Melanotaenia boesemani]|uniref:jouberin isoform X1 n=1 Tax=Melanotaenia boesemani TaxID=1250792 RepID=UPI001C0554C8|nr:jouberin isoform X1 [Melanotaenia boesemani]
MQQIYRQRDEQLEVYTTVFSPQVCRTRTRHVQANKVVAARIRYRSRWPKELDLDQGDLIQVLFKEDEAWWFGRLMNGDEGYFPVACVESLQGGDSSRATPTLLRRGSVPVVPQTAGAPCGCTSGRRTPKLLRKSSIQHQLEPNGAPERPDSGTPSGPRQSPSLLHRVLAKSRRKSCPQLRHHRLDTSSDNSAFQLD